VFHPWPKRLTFISLSRYKVEFYFMNASFKGPLTDLFEPSLRKIYSHITSSFLVSSELFHVF